MVNEKMVSKVKEVLADYNGQHKGYSLAMLITNTFPGGIIGMDWTLLISSPWLDEMNIRDVISYFLTSLKGTGVNNIKVIHTDDPLIDLINQIYPISSNDKYQELTNNSEIGNIRFDRAYIIESKRLKKSQPPETPQRIDIRIPFKVEEDELFVRITKEANYFIVRAYKNDGTPANGYRYQVETSINKQFTEENIKTAVQNLIDIAINDVKNKLWEKNMEVVQE